MVFSPAKRWLTEPDQNSGNLLLGQLDRKPNVEQNVSQNKLIKVCTLHGEERVKKMLGTQKKRANWFWLHRIYCNFILLCTILIENLSPPVSLLLASLVIEDFLSLQCLFRSKNILQIRWGKSSICVRELRSKLQRIRLLTRPGNALTSNNIFCSLGYV